MKLPVTDAIVIVVPVVISVVPLTSCATTKPYAPVLTPVILSPATGIAEGVPLIVSLVNILISKRYRLYCASVPNSLCEFAVPETCSNPLARATPI